MTRRLTFSGDKAAQRFAFLREGFIVGGLTDGQAGKPKPRDVIRLEARVLDALDAVSEPVAGETRLAGDVEFRALHDGLPGLALSQVEWELIDRYLTSAPWSTHKAREIADMLDWFGAADKVDD